MRAVDDEWDASDPRGRPHDPHDGGPAGVDGFEGSALIIMTRRLRGAAFHRAMAEKQ